MIDFGLFCDIKKHLEKAALHKRMSFDKKAILMLAEDETGTDAVAELIKNCDIKSVQNLMSYFEKNAPIQTLLRARYKELKSYEEQENINEYIAKELKKTENFYIYLCSLIESKGFKTDADFYNYIGMTRQTFAKIRKKGARVSRNHALLMAAGLKLNYNEAVEFMAKAGYVFRTDNTREVIISYVMRNKKYDLTELDEILISFGESPLMDIL